MQDPFYMLEEENENNSFSSLKHYLRHWKWFVLSVMLCLNFAFIKLRYTTPQFKATAKILVRDEKKGSLPSELGAFADLGLLSGMKNNVDNEIEILNSITLIEKTVQKLHFNITSYLIGNIRDIEVYKETEPFEFTVVNASDKFYQNTTNFKIKITSAKNFEILLSDGKVLGSFHFGTPILIDEARIVVQKLPTFNAINPVGNSYEIFCDPIRAVASGYSSLLTVESLSKTSSIVNLEMANAVPKKAEEFLDELITIYNEEAINDKNMISENTQKFIQKRLVNISEELGDEESKAKGFKETNQLFDIPTNAKIYLDNYSEVEKGLIETETKLRVIEIMIDFMKHKSKSELVPAELIPTERASGPTNPLILQYNNLVLQNNRLIKDGKKSNSTLVNIDQQLTDLERDIMQSLVQFKGTILVERTNLNKQYDVLSDKINQIPTQEREFRIIERQQKIKEGLYLYLIQKREETAISLSVTEPNAKIIDTGRASLIPISPKKSVFYLVALFIGLGIPFGILFLIFKLDDKIHNANDVEVNSKNVPILAELPSLDENSASASQNLEAFRTLAHNTEFITPFTDSKLGKVFFVTSSIKGEGKTFVSYNLANAFAHLDKKILLVGADFRNPQLHKYLDQMRKVSKGLSNYLHDASLQWQDLVCRNKGDEFSFDVLLSGDIPPNPTLLLSNQRFNSFIEEVKKEYDIIVFDTPPTLLVTDSLIISKYADTTLYVVRSGVTEKNLVAYSSKLHVDKKIINMGYVINDVDLTSSYGYGYNYGYGYGYGKDTEKKAWYKRFI
ncbi:GumC family protein [Flavobacterium sp. LT1R49]|uniref:GumC family protein n=1 Tax=Flavobacterium arabinosi TaxID=3398737 RepID=UPI003A8B71EC